MPPRSNSTSSEAVIAANEDFLAATGGLLLADAMTIHEAIHDAAAPANVTVSSGIDLPIFVSGNGARRCDYIIDPAVRPLGRCKLMAQNTQKESATARRALAGAKITHILPLDRAGRHTNAPYASDWGCIEDGRLTKNCPAVLNQSSVPPTMAAAAAKSKKRRREEAASSGTRIDLDCPFEDKDEAKKLGAKWDQAAKVWYVQGGDDLGPFRRWLPQPDAQGSSGLAKTVD